MTLIIAIIYFLQRENSEKKSDFWLIVVLIVY